MCSPPVRLSNPRLVICMYFQSVAVLLLLAAVAKIVSACGVALILKQTDPVLFIPYRLVLFNAGIIEVIIACVCLFCDATAIKAWLIAWLATIFLIYRIGLFWLTDESFI